LSKAREKNDYNGYDPMKDKENMNDGDDDCQPQGIWETKST